MEKENIENLSVSGEKTTEIDNNQYIEALKEMKEKSVDRSKYDELKNENKKLLDAIVNGATIESIAQDEKAKPTIDELRKNFFKENQTNLEYVENALALRDALIENGERDPFLPYGQNLAPTDEDIKAANRVADKLRECVDYAEGDSSIFTDKLQRELSEVKIK